MAETRLNMAEDKKEFQQIMNLMNQGANFLLSGGAGSGKTYSLVEVIREVISNNPTTKVACMTYTNAAVKEIEERVNHKNLNVSTIHDFLWDNIKHFQSELKSAIISLINDENIPNIKITGFETVPDDFYKDIEGVKYQESLRLKEGIISHDELILISEYMFSKYPKLCNVVKDRYKYIFVDEYQDTHSDIIKIFLNHFNRGTKNCVIGFFGDTMQSIYDDSVENLDKYRENRLVTEVLKVHNRRNPQKVIDLANKLRTDGLQQEPSTDVSAPNMKDGIVKEGKIIFLYSSDGNINKVKEHLTNEFGWNFTNPNSTKELNLTHNLIAGKAGFGTLYDIYDKEPIIKYIRLIRKYISNRKVEITTDITLESMVTLIVTDIKKEVDTLSLRSFTVRKYLESLRLKDGVDVAKINKLISDLKIKGNKITSEQKLIVAQFKKDTRIEDVDYIYEIELLKDILQEIKPDYHSLYDTIKYEKYDKIKNLYVDKDQLIDDKKQEEDDEKRKGSKRDNLIKHLFKIQDTISLYNNGCYAEFLKATDYKKLNSVNDKKTLKESIEILSKTENKTIEQIITIANDKGICKIEDKLNIFKKENKYLYNRVKEVKYSEFQDLYKYLEGHTPFSTQHKTKGNEFDNVFVILDNGKWNNYNFEKLFTEIDSSQVIDRTKKIFYVCCTRAKEQLAVYYHKPTQGVLTKAEEWFGDVINLDNYDN